MASSDELLLLYDQLLDLGRLMLERLKTPGTYEDLVLHNGDFLPLLIIASQEGMSQAELAQHLHRTKGAASVIVDKLENSGLVTRVHSDTRCLLHLTEKGRRICIQKRSRDLVYADAIMESLPLDRDELETANHVIAELIQFCLTDACRKQEKLRN